MESIALLCIYLKSDVIRNTFESLEPFLNIEQEDGSYYRRIVIILKMLFTLHMFESTSPNYIIWLIVLIINAFFISKCPSIAVLPAAVHSFLFFACSTKFGIYISMALLCIISMNIKSCEFILDLLTLIVIVVYSYQTYHNELQKLWTVVYITFAIGSYVNNLHIFSLRQLGLIACFLILIYIPLKPDTHNKYKYRFLYFYVLMFIWIAYKFQSINLHDTQTQIGKVELQKRWGYYETSETANNVQGEKIPKTIPNEKIMDVEERLKADLLMQDNNASKEKVIRREIKQNNKRLKLQYMEKTNNKFHSPKTAEKEPKLRNEFRKSSVFDEEFIFKENSDSVEEEETKNKHRRKDSVSNKRTDEILLKKKVHKPIEKSEKLMVINNKQMKKKLINEKESMEYEESATCEPFESSKYEKRNHQFTKEQLDRNNLKREINTIGRMKKKTKVQRIIRQDNPNNRVEFETMQALTGEDTPKSDIIEKQFKEDTLRFESDTQKYPSQKSGESNNEVKFQDDELYVFGEDKGFENFEFKMTVNPNKHNLERYEHSNGDLDENQFESNAFVNSKQIQAPERKIYTLDSLIHTIRDPTTYIQRKLRNTRHTSFTKKYPQNIEFVVDRKSEAMKIYLDNMKKIKWNAKTKKS